MSVPFEIESEDRLYVMHKFVSGQEAAVNQGQYMTEDEIRECQIRGWRCIICGQTTSECARRNPMRPKTVGTRDWIGSAVPVTMGTAAKEV